VIGAGNCVSKARQASAPTATVPATAAAIMKALEAVSILFPSTEVLSNLAPKDAEHQLITGQPAGPAANPILPAEETEHMNKIENVCVYCGSSNGNDPHFQESARSLGAAMAREGIGLVYGGGNNGLMGTLARSVLEGGGRVCGIIPDFLKQRESMLSEAQELVVVPDMHTRKRIMFERADAFVALPGGVGTLEELVEQLTWAQLGRHKKPVLIADIGGFWRPLLSLLAHMRENGFIRSEFEVHYLVAERIEDVLPMLRTAAAHVSRKEEATSLDPRL
jgi:uncharacterized protein (TIGR00730 family)